MGLSSSDEPVKVEGDTAASVPPFSLSSCQREIKGFS